MEEELIEINLAEDTASRILLFSEEFGSPSYRIQVTELPVGATVFWRFTNDPTLTALTLGTNTLTNREQFIDGYSLIVVPDENNTVITGDFAATFKPTSNSADDILRRFELEIDPANDAPSSITLSNATVSENAVGAVVGTVTATDPDIGDVIQLSVAIDGSGKFEVENGQLRLKAGEALDFEEAETYEVTLEAKDQDGARLFETVTITAIDAVDTPRPTGTGDRVGTDTSEILIAEPEDTSVSGAGGNDTINGSVEDDELNGDAGDDEIRGGDGDDILRGGNDDDLLAGDQGEDNLIGGLGDDTLFGHAHDDRLTGGGGDDALRGGGGDDMLYGGSGEDMLTGGTGADVFEFRSVTDSAADDTSDRILDFDTAEDVMDLSAITGPALSYAGASGFVGNGIGSVTVQANTAGNTLVRIDVDGDRVTDMLIRVVDTTGLTADDFIL